MVEASGLRLEPPFICCMVTFPTLDTRLMLLERDFEEWQAWVDSVIDLLHVRLGGVACYTEHGIIMLLPFVTKTAKSTQAPAKWVTQLSQVIEDGFRKLDYMIGVSTADTDIKTVYSQAFEAVRVGPIFHPERHMHYWSDLGVNRLLIEQAKSAVGLAFIQDYLGPLLEPTPRNAEWLMTLQEFVSGDSMNEIAIRLHVHPKTLAFRKKKIEKLLQIDIDDPEQRLNLAIALKVKRLRENL